VVYGPNVLGRSRQGASGAQDPKDTIEDTTVVHPRNATRLVRQHRLDSNPFIIGEFVAHDSSPRFGSLNHGDLAGRNAPGPAPAYGQKRTLPVDSPAESVENEPKADVFEKLLIPGELAYALCVGS
jgi:hypothetical protein